MKTLFAVAVASLCAAGTLAVPVTVQNPNFEYPSLNPCGFGASAPGWTGAQVWRPCLPQYFNDFPCAHGVQVGFTNGGPLTQTVSATLQPFTRVVLRTDVGMRLDGFTTGTYRIEVLAGATVIASDESTVVPPPGGFVTATATADVLARSAGLGEALTIRLTRVSGSQADFDVVRLDLYDIDCNDNGIDDAIDIAGGLLVDTDGDGIADACDDDPDGGPEPATPDINVDGFVDAEDLAILLSSWGNCTPGVSCCTDLDGNGVVGPGDLAILLGNWG
ncbi:MAG: hypothetical protein KDA25_06210 [Phycisphaerales bacterium]|nr:hypothetical protein [Phycisphaerales bacterium]